MEPSKATAGGANGTDSSSWQESSNNSAAEIVRQYLASNASLPTQQPSARMPNSAPERQATTDNADDVSALLLRLVMANTNASGSGCLPQPSGSSSTTTTQGNSSLELIQRLSQSDPNAIAILATCSKADLKAANLQAQALLRQQEETLRNTRLLLQQQLDQVLSDEVNPHTVASAAPAAATEDSHSSNRARAPSPTGSKGILASPNGKRPSTKKEGSSQEEETAPLPEDEASNDGAACEPTRESLEGVQYDDDDLDDDAYFKNFDKEDSHKVNNETFPFRLYRMLYEVEKSGKQDVASFSTDGQMFCVRKPKRFVEEVMPQYFTTSRLASFQRQLNLYGFQRVSEGGLRGSYFHESFQKGKRAQCRKIKRQRTRTKPTAGTSNGMATSQSAPSVLSPTNNLSFSNALAMPGAIPGRNSLLFANASAAAELLRRAAATIELDRARDARASITLQTLLESPQVGRTSTPLTNGNISAASSLISSIQNSPNLRRSFSAPAGDPAPSSTNAMGVQRAMMISRLQRENEEMAQRLQAERDAPGRKRDPV